MSHDLLLFLYQVLLLLYQVLLLLYQVKHILIKFTGCHSLRRLKIYLHLSHKMT